MFPCHYSTVESLQVVVIMSSEPISNFDIITQLRVTHEGKNIETVAWLRSYMCNYLTLSGSGTRNVSE